jgi:hypothetical protein
MSDFENDTQHVVTRDRASAPAEQDANLPIMSDNPVLAAAEAIAADALAEVAAEALSTALAVVEAAAIAATNAARKAELADLAAAAVAADTAAEVVAEAGAASDAIVRAASLAAERAAELSTHMVSGTVPRLSLEHVAAETLASAQTVVAAAKAAADRATARAESAAAAAAEVAARGAAEIVDDAAAVAAAAAFAASSAASVAALRIEQIHAEVERAAHSTAAYVGVQLAPTDMGGVAPPSSVLATEVALWPGGFRFDAPFIAPTTERGSMPTDVHVSAEENRAGSLHVDHAAWAEDLLRQEPAAHEYVSASAQVHALLAIAHELAQLNEFLALHRRKQDLPGAAA